MITIKNIRPSHILSLLCFCCYFASLWKVEAEKEAWGSRLVVKRDERKTVLESEFGEISSVLIGDVTQINGRFHLQFFKLEPGALFLPVMLHSEMLLYCHTGSGDLTWIGHGKKSKTVSLSRGDIYRIRQGSVFFIRSNLETDQRERLRITVLFANSDEDLHSGFSSMGPYSSISDLVRGFGSNVLQAAFQVPEEVIQTIKGATKQPLIIQDVSKSQPEEGQSQDWEGRFMRLYKSLEGARMENKKKDKESRAFNVYTADRDFENCNGWSLTVTSKDHEVFKDSEFGAFYVNLTNGAMMAPHWNPMASEIAFVVAGHGMVKVVCPSSQGNQSGCENQSFRVEEGDVFMVPRFHPMSQTSFNNGSFVFMGFSTSGNRIYPQYLVGKQSVFQVIDKDVLAAAFNVDNVTVTQLSRQQEEALIVECTSCAEEQFSAWKEEEWKKREAEERRKREEEAREREEEERRKEEEEAKKREEEAREREEERRREEEEARKREEEAREREEERRREEEEARKREEEAREREEERHREEEEAREREEEEARKREEEAREREEERRREEEEAREREEEEARKREEEEAREQERKRQEEEAARKEKEERRQKEEQAKREEEERRQKEEEESAEQERRQREEEARRQEERKQREEEERAERERRQREEEGKGGGGGESEEEAARRQEEERERREQEEQQGGGGGSGEESEGVPAKAPKVRQPRRHYRQGRHQPQEGEGGGQGESKGEAAMRQEAERIRRERGKSTEPPIFLLENL